MATYQCRIDDQGMYPLLDAMGDLYGRVERTLLADLLRKRDVTQLKREYQPRFGINARQFNAVGISVQGKIDAVREGNRVRMQDLGASIRRTEEKVSVRARWRRRESPEEAADPRRNAGSEQ